MPNQRTATPDGSRRDIRPETGRNAGWARKIAVWTLCIPIVFYQRCISPVTPPACRFTPTCSEYARQAIVRHGPLKGLWLAVRRILRCHPWGGSGYDPVP